MRLTYSRLLYVVIMPKLLKGNNRRYYNIHNITLDIESNTQPLDHNRIKNYEVTCLSCGYIVILTVTTALRGTSLCPRCRRKIRANPLRNKAKAKENEKINKNYILYFNNKHKLKKQVQNDDIKTLALAFNTAFIRTIKLIINQRIILKLR